MTKYEKPRVVDTKKSGKAPTASFSPPQEEATETAGSNPDLGKCGKSKEEPVEPEQKSKSSKKKCCG